MGFLVKRSRPESAAEDAADADVDTVVHELRRPLTEVDHVMVEEQARSPRIFAWVSGGRS
jgi:hypothetical protein